MTRPGSLLALLVVLSAFTPLAAGAATYEVGPGQALAAIGDVPWESLGPGDVVRIHARAEPYAEKWVLCAKGTEAQPVRVVGVPDGAGNLPVITGANATTRGALSFWNEARALLKIGGASTPACDFPEWVVVENLHLRGARSTNTFTNAAGASTAFATNAAAIFVESGRHVTIRGCELEDSGNGLFSAVATEDLRILGNHLHGNGNPSRVFEHNAYTAAHGILYEGNRFGPLCAGCQGNALKDRSTGTVVRANWIEGGNRQLDLVDCEDDPTLVNDARYGDTYVYANVLVEPAGEGNAQIVHFGGDSGTTSIYRPRLWFWNNTVVSRRTDRTTLFRLSTPAQRAQAWNNVVWVAPAGSTLGLVDEDGDLVYGGNWMKPGVVASHSGAPTGTITDEGNVLGAEPGFANAGADDFSLAEGSACLDAARPLPAAVAAHPLEVQYVPHQATTPRPAGGVRDLGAFERGTGVPPPPEPGGDPAKAHDRGCGCLGASWGAPAGMIAASVWPRRRRHGR